jgi:hypothetical protein
MHAFDVHSMFGVCVQYVFRMCSVCRCVLDTICVQCALCWLDACVPDVDAVIRGHSWDQLEGHLEQGRGPPGSHQELRGQPGPGCGFLTLASSKEVRGI